MLTRHSVSPAQTVSVQYNGGNTAYNCSCPQQGPHHDPHCQCRCGYCDRHRSCPCATQGTCSCQVMCNCKCADCHTSASSRPPSNDQAIKVEAGESGTDTKKRKRANHTVKDAGKDRTCATENCTNIAPVNGQTGTVCKACFKKRQTERQCITPECINLAPANGPTGKVCRECAKDPLKADNDPGVSRKCAEAGCTMPAPVGGTSGKYCAQHYRAILNKRAQAKKVKTE